MIIVFSKYDRKGYGSEYIEARRKIDVLSGLIKSRTVSRGDALDIYRTIESDYRRFDPARGDLFAMIYKSRVVRLIEQFGEGVRDEG